MRGSPARGSPRSSSGGAVGRGGHAAPVLGRAVTAALPPAGPSWWAWARWGSVGGLVLAALVYATHDLLPILFASAVLAYLLDRPVSWLHARGLSRDQAFLIIVAFVTTAGVVVLTVVAPSLFEQVGALAVRIRPAIAGIEAQARPLALQFEDRTGVHLPLNFNDVVDVATEYVQVPDVQEALKGWVAGVFGSGLAFIQAVLTLSLLPLFTFYLVSEWPKVLSGVDGLVPPRHRPLLHEVASEIHERIGGFVEGQLTLCAILGVLYSVGLSIVGIDLAVTVGLGSGALFIVPYVGALAGVALSVMLSVVKFGLDWHILGCVGTFAVVQLIEGSWLTPQIVGQRVGLHPLVVMVAVVSGASLLGVWGVLLAVPTTAAISVLAGALLRGYTSSRFYGGPAGEGRRG
ncbi:MAG: AI-2E family transporter [Myxococcales bacterium]|nr:AI-2E family transporter [Myxococcales bacterium]